MSDVLFTASITIHASGQDSFYLLLSDENETHLMRKCYALSQTLLHQCHNVKKCSVELSNGKKIDYVETTRLTQAEKDNAILEWYKP